MLKKFCRRTTLEPLSEVTLCQFHDCLRDPTRLRIIHLLLDGPLCVCHLQELLGLEQVAVSKHLAYLRARDMVAARRHQNWMIYSLPAKPSPVLAAHLECVRQCADSEPQLRTDARRLKKLKPEITWLAESGCCA